MVIVTLAAIAACAMPPPESATFAVPESTTRVTVGRTPTHAFLAEYDRNLMIEVEGRLVSRLAMFPDVDTGGYSRANLYRIDAQSVLLRDAGSSYTIDVVTGTVSKDEKRRAAGTFLGSFDEDDARTWRFIFAHERPERPTEFSGGS